MTTRQLRIVIPCVARQTTTAADGIDLKRCITITTCTSRLASDNGVLLPDGGDFSLFAQRPVVLWSHQNRELGIGRAIAWRRVGDGWEHDIEFAPEDVNPFAEQVRKFVDWAGFAAASISFEVTDDNSTPTAEERILYGIPKYGWIGRTWRLLEVSLCNVQADPGAVMKHAVADGMTHETAEVFARDGAHAQYARILREAPDRIDEEILALRRPSSRSESDVIAQIGAMISPIRDSMAAAADVMRSTAGALSLVSEGIGAMLRQNAQIGDLVVQVKDSIDALCADAMNEPAADAVGTESVTVAGDIYDAIDSLESKQKA